MNPNRRPLERTGRRSKALESIAYHEAGHAFMASHFQIPFKEATVIPGEDYLGAVIELKVKRLRKNIGRGPATREKLGKWVLVLLAGGIAEQAFLGRGRSKGSLKDHSTAITLADFVIADCDPRVESAYLDYMSVRAEQILKMHWPQVKAIAEELVRQRTITAETVEQAVRSERVMKEWDRWVQQIVSDSYSLEESLTEFVARKCG